MAIITVPPINAGVAKRAEVKAAIDAVANEFNGNIDNANIKAGAAIATSKLASDAGIVAAMLASGSVTGAKLNIVPGSARVATSETTTSATYADLATVGPSVTVTTGVSGILLVAVSADMAHSGAQTLFASFVIRNAGDTADVIAADDSRSIRAFGTNNVRYSSISVVNAGLSPSTTYIVRMKYRTGGATATYQQRELFVLPL